MLHTVARELGVLKKITCLILERGLIWGRRLKLIEVHVFEMSCQAMLRPLEFSGSLKCRFLVWYTIVWWSSNVMCSTLFTILDYWNCLLFMNIDVSLSGADVVFCVWLQSEFIWICNVSIAVNWSIVSSVNIFFSIIFKYLNDIVFWSYLSHC